MRGSRLRAGSRRCDVAEWTAVQEASYAEINTGIRIHGHPQTGRSATVGSGYRHFWTTCSAESTGLGLAYRESPLDLPHISALQRLSCHASGPRPLSEASEALDEPSSRHKVGPGRARRVVVMWTGSIWSTRGMQRGVVVRCCCCRVVEWLVDLFGDVSSRDSGFGY
jgi:hypothetical protein